MTLALYGHRWLLALACAGAACAAQAQPDTAAADDEPTWRTTASFEAWVYGSRSELAGDSLLNPGNRVAGLASGAALLDARFNLRAEKGPFEFIANPRLLDQRNHIGGSDATQWVHSATLNQGLMRYKQGDNALTVGRELFTWGPASFRSPSSPFYFDAGRTNPLATTPGIDLARYTLGLGSVRVTGAWVFSTRLVQPAQDLSRTALLKLDQQGSSHLLSLILARQRGGEPFVGGFAQFTPDDAWLVYGEFGSSRQPVALSPTAPGSPGPFYTAERPAPRSQTVLLGTNYTLENGQALIGEYLRNTGGYSGAQADAYFRQASAAGLLAQRNPATGYAALGQALGQAPRLLWRDYLWLNWQSNPQESGLQWRAGWTQNLGDRSGQALLYLEKNFQPKVSGFLALNVNQGRTNTEYGALMRSVATFGLKLFVF